MSYQRRKPIQEISMPSKIDGIMNRIKSVANVATQKDLAVFLGIRPSSISAALKKENLPPNWLLTLLQEHSINPRWILTGQGKKYLAPVDSLDGLNDMPLSEALKIVLANKGNLFAHFEASDLLEEVYRRALINEAAEKQRADISAMIDEVVERKVDEKLKNK